MNIRFCALHLSLPAYFLSLCSWQIAAHLWQKGVIILSEVHLHSIFAEIYGQITQLSPKNVYESSFSLYLSKLYLRVYIFSRQTERIEIWRNFTKQMSLLPRTSMNVISMTDVFLRNASELVFYRKVTYGLTETQLFLRDFVIVFYFFI